MAINKDEISLDREALKAAAADYHAQGFNCAQSVICAMAPKLGLDDHTAFALAEGFGAGMGGMTETCGAIAGGIMALGQVRSSGFDAPGSKGATYRMARAYCDAFRDKNGSTICRELKGVGTDTGALRSCAGCIDDAIDIHDFRMVAGPTHTNLIFDAVVPFGFRLTDQEVEQKIRSAVRALDGNYYAVVNVERSYT